MCIYLVDREGEGYVIAVYGDETDLGKFDLTLKDCHVHGDDYLPKDPPTVIPQHSAHRVVPTPTEIRSYRNQKKSVSGPKKSIHAVEPDPHR